MGIWRFVGAAAFGVAGALSSSTRNRRVGGTMRPGRAGSTGASAVGWGSSTIAGAVKGAVGSTVSKFFGSVSSVWSDGGVRLTFTSRGGGNGLEAGLLVSVVRALDRALFGPLAFGLPVNMGPLGMLRPRARAMRSTN